MLASLMVKFHGVKQVIMHVSSTNYLKSIRKIGIDSVVSKNISAVNDVLKIIQSNKEEITISPFEEIHIDALEIKANDNCKYFSRQYKIDDIPKSMCLAAIVRNNNVIIPTFNTSLEPNDNLLIFLNQETISKAESLFK